MVSGVGSRNEECSTSDRMPRPLPGTARIARWSSPTDQLVFSIAQQDEVELQQPFQEVDGLADLLR